MKREGGIPWPHRLPSAAIHSSHLPLPSRTPQSPEANLSLPRAEPPGPTQCHLLGCHSRDLLPRPPTAGWRVSSWDCCEEKARCQCLLISHHEEHLYGCIHHSHPHPSPHKYMGESSRREQGATIQDYATEGDNAWE